MAVSPWQDILAVQPLDTQVVWVRRLMVEIPYLATWDDAAATFTFSNGWIIPWYYISKWRPQ